MVSIGEKSKIGNLEIKNRIVRSATNEHLGDENGCITKDYIEGINMLSNMRLCSNVPAQMVVQTCLGGYQSSQELLVPGGRVFEQRELVNRMINDIPGLSMVKPSGAFY